MEERKMSRKKRFKTDIALILAIVFAFVQMLPGVVVAVGNKGPVEGSFTAAADPRITDISVNAGSRAEVEGEEVTDASVEYRAGQGASVVITVNDNELEVTLANDTMDTMELIADELEQQLTNDGVTNIDIVAVRNGDNAKLKFTAHDEKIEVESGANSSYIGINDTIDEDPSMALSPGQNYNISVTVDSPDTLEALDNLELRLWYVTDAAVTITKSAFEALNDVGTNPVTYASIVWDQDSNTLGEISAGAVTAGAIKDANKLKAFHWDVTAEEGESGEGIPLSFLIDEVTNFEFVFDVRIGRIAKLPEGDGQWQIAAVIRDSDGIVDFEAFERSEGTQGIDMNPIYSLFKQDTVPAEWREVDAGSRFTTASAITVSGLTFLANAQFDVRVRAADEWANAADPEDVIPRRSGESNVTGASFGLQAGTTSGAGIDLPQSAAETESITTSGAFDLNFSSYDDSKYDAETWLSLALGDDVPGGREYQGIITYVISSYTTN